jgi:cellobiose-specific phosphotransferase system component IIA
MDIPDEAIRAAAQARLGPSPRLEELLESALAYELNKAEDQLEAAAPHIARSAQVAVLHEMATEDDAEIAHLTVREGNTVVGSQAARDIAVRISAVHKSKARFERKVAELEAGAGQTGEGNV